MLLYIFISILIIALAFVMIIVLKIQKDNYERMYRAAQRIVQDEYLDYSISNPFFKCDEHLFRNKKKLMVKIKTKGSKQSKEYVLDPARPIKIGRDNTNSIVIDEATVSLEQCVLYLYNDQLVLTDRNSSNGAVIKRNAKKHLLSDGNSIIIENNDIIIIGALKLKITIFYYDMVWM